MLPTNSHTYGNIVAILLALAVIYVAIRLFSKKSGSEEAPPSASSPRTARTARALDLVADWWKKDAVGIIIVVVLIIGFVYQAFTTGPLTSTPKSPPFTSVGTWAFRHWPFVMFLAVAVELLSAWYIVDAAWKKRVQQTVLFVTLFLFSSYVWGPWIDPYLPDAKGAVITATPIQQQVNCGEFSTAQNTCEPPRRTTPGYLRAKSRSREACPRHMR